MTPWCTSEWPLWWTVFSLKTAWLSSLLHELVGAPSRHRVWAMARARWSRAWWETVGTHPQRWFFPPLSSQPLSTQFSPTLLRAIYQKAPQVIVNPVIQGKLLALWTGKICLPNSRKYLKTRMDVCFHVAGPHRGWKQASRYRGHCHQDLHLPSRGRKAARVMWLTEVQG